MECSVDVCAGSGGGADGFGSAEGAACVAEWVAEVVASSDPVVGVLGWGCLFPVGGVLAPCFVAGVGDLELCGGSVGEGVAESVGDDDVALFDPESSASLCAEGSEPDEASCAGGGWVDEVVVAGDDGGVM